MSEENNATHSGLDSLATNKEVESRIPFAKVSYVVARDKREFGFDEFEWLRNPKGVGDAGKSSIGLAQDSIEANGTAGEHPRKHLRKKRSGKRRYDGAVITIGLSAIAAIVFQSFFGKVKRKLKRRIFKLRYHHESASVYFKSTQARD